uniref:(northern house mosquito) hypothetical protein n=1 Tax=Culex pipiens TaxID=7175 RepID=A0A8D8H6V8_CULPI
MTTTTTVVVLTEDLDTRAPATTLPVTHSPSTVFYARSLAPRNTLQSAECEGKEEPQQAKETKFIHLFCRFSTIFTRFSGKKYQIDVQSIPGHILRHFSLGLEALFTR